MTLRIEPVEHQDGGTGHVEPGHEVDVFKCIIAALESKLAEAEKERDAALNLVRLHRESERRIASVLEALSTDWKQEAA